MSYVGAGFIILSPECTHTLLVNDSRSKKWGFPKGHREKVDEDDLATAVRECNEETGLSASDYKVHSEVFRVSKGSQSYLFRYAILKTDMNKVKIHPAPPNEISECRWVPIADLIGANQIYDGNKYLRNWISDLKNDVSKKSVHIFKKLCTLRLTPANEPMSPSNVVTCP
jgi:8-oxo-dGTP pyrophosphatase MutT (NUDIX family)